MIASSWDRSRRISATARVLTVIAVAAGVLMVALSVSLPEAWWPHTRQAFSAGTPSTRQDPCRRIWGPAHAYCERGNSASPDGGHGGAAWKLVPPAAGLAALVLWRRQNAVGQRRH